MYMDTIERDIFEKSAQARILKESAVPLYQNKNNTTSSI